MGELTQTLNQLQSILDYAIAPSAPLATGTLLAGDANGAPTPVSMGAAGQVLTVTDTGTTGLAWVTPSAEPTTPPITYVNFTAQLSEEDGSLTLSTSTSFNTVWAAIAAGSVAIARVSWTPPDYPITLIMDWPLTTTNTGDTNTINFAGSGMPGMFGAQIHVVVSWAASGAITASYFDYADPQSNNES